MNCSRVYMLACDHRWQWEDWCDAHDVARHRIADVKRIVYDAFLEARRREADIRQFGALLVDSVYAGETLARAREAGIPVGAPVEKAGRFPLEWQDDPFHAGATGNSFVKVLVRYRPEWPEDHKRAQLEKLLALQAWCRGQAMPLLVEILIMRTCEDEDQFEAVGRPALLADLIRGLYADGLVPELWKIEAASTAEGAGLIDRAIREQPAPRQLILGKGADQARILQWFAASAPLPSTAGFAIGRSVFWDPATAFLAGRCSEAETAEVVTSRYLALVEAWKRLEHKAVS